MSDEKQQKDACLLQLQIGPVQDFIAQARSTRDLWSGSYLISWLMAHAIHGLENSNQKVEIVFPAIAVAGGTTTLQQPLVRYLREGKLPNGVTVDQILSPNLPNLLLAVVPGNWTEKEVEKHVLDPMKAVWDEEQKECLKYYQDQFGKDDAFSQDEIDLFHDQSKRFWQFTWQLWPMHDPDTLLKLTKGMPQSEAITAHLNKLIDDKADSGDKRLWETHFRFASHRLDARRQTRNFGAWPVTPSLATRDKDSVSGREEAIADKVWLARARNCEDLRYRFRAGDQLGASNLIKRVWDLAYLQAKHPALVRTRVKYDSVPGVAAGTWLAALREKWANPKVREAFERFSAIMRDARRFIPPPANGPRDGVPLHPLDAIDAQVFHISTWEAWMREADDEAGPRDNVQRILPDGISALEVLYDAAGIGKPGRYFAVLALDGDQMGAWLSGEKHPPGSSPTKEWHQKFSQALADFALEHVRKIVEKNNGQLIYAGGDDVLVMLPADSAIACSRELSAKFREVLAKDKVADDATASVGIAIGHMKAPLQDMVGAAQDAERTAKRERGTGGFGRNAFAVTLFKRSGELVEWGASFKWKTLPRLLELMQAHYHSPPGKPNAKPAITGRFPHVIVERLSAYGLDSELQPAAATNGTPTLLDIAKAEFDWVVQRQTGLGDKVPNQPYLDKLRADLRTAGHNFLDELAKEKAPLQWFTGLFSVEAFINQQRD